MNELERTNPNFTGNFDDDEDTINLRVMFHYVFTRWRRILIWGIVIAVVLGGAKFAKGLVDLNDPEVVADRNSDASAKAYQKKVLKQNIKDIRQQMADAQEYTQNSVLMNIDPNKVYRAHIVYYIDTHYQIDPNLSQQDPDKSGSVLGAYLNAAQDGSLLSYVKKNISNDIDEKYLRELINVTADYDANMLNISVVGDTDLLVNEISEAIKTNVESQKVNIDATIAEHDLTLISDMHYQTADPKIQDDITEGKDVGLSSTDINVASAQQAYTDIIADLQTKQDTLSTQLDGLKSSADDTEAFDMNAVVKSAVKYAVIGLILGFALVVVWLIVKYIGVGKVMDGDDISQQYGVRVLGEYYQPVKKRAFWRLDRFIAKMVPHNSAQEDLGNVCRIAAANIKAAVGTVAGRDGEDGAEGKLLLCGQNEEVLNNISESLGKEYKADKVKDILFDPSGIEALEESRYVVLVLKKEVTRIKDLEGMLAQIRNQGKTLCGVVVV